MKKLIFLSIVFLSLFANCEIPNPFEIPKGWTKYTIFPESYKCKYDECWGTANGHKSSPYLLHAIKDTAFVFEFVFPDRGYIYDIGQEQSDWNKLYGITDYLNNIHTESYRFSWRWFNQELQIGYYIHIDEDIFKGIIYVTDVGEMITGVIDVTEGEVAFKIISGFMVAEKIISDDRIRCIEKGYTSPPYFGGNKALPENEEPVRILIKTDCLISALKQ